MILVSEINNQFKFKTKPMNKLTKSVAGLMLALSAFSFSSCDDDEKVIGLDDSAKYGNIKLKFDGERPDGEDFTETVNFRFLPANGPDGSSTVSEDGDTYHSFEVGRLLNPFESNEDNYAFLSLSANTEDDEPTFNGSIEFSTVFISDDETYFSYGREVSFSTDDITQYEYNEDNGKLTVKFEVETTGPNGDDMTITGEVRVTVFQELFVP